MPTGKTKWFSETKGYGFICPDSGGPDAFVHIKDLQSSGLATLHENERVRYDMKAGKNGRESACNLSII